MADTRIKKTAQIMTRYDFGIQTGQQALLQTAPLAGEFNLTKNMFFDNFFYKKGKSVIQ